MHFFKKLLDISFNSVFTLLPCSQPWSRDKIWCFDAHAQWLQGILPGHADAQPVIHKRWLQTCPPTHRSPSEDDSSLVFCTAKLLTHFYQSGKVSARKQMILHNKLNGAFFFCWIRSVPHAVASAFWRQFGHKLMTPVRPLQTPQRFSDSSLNIHVFPKQFSLSNLKNVSSGVNYALAGHLPVKGRLWKKKNQLW